MLIRAWAGLVSLSIDPRPGLPLADQAAERAAFEFEGVRILQCHAAAVGLAVLGIVDLSGPLVRRAGGVHSEHDRNAHQRPVASRRIRLAVVGLPPAGLPIVRPLWPRPPPPQPRP